MELPHLGDNCSDPSCKKLDFLPVKCDGCSKTYCNDHYHYANHNCPTAYKKNVQVPVCPLCNTPIPVARGQTPDIAVGDHIDRDCQADPAKDRRKVFANRCSMKGCRTKEIVPIVCTECTLNYCLKHRHITDHNCEGKATALRRKAANAVATRQRVSNSVPSRSADIQGTMDEDEALARALALSMQESTTTKAMTQEEIDERLARQLQEQEQTTGRSRSNTIRDRCQLS